MSELWEGVFEGLDDPRAPNVQRPPPERTGGQQRPPVRVRCWRGRRATRIVLAFGDFVGTGAKSFRPFLLPQGLPMSFDPGGITSFTAEGAASRATALGLFDYCLNCDSFDFGIYKISRLLLYAELLTPGISPCTLTLSLKGEGILERPCYLSQDDCKARP